MTEIDVRLCSNCNMEHQFIRNWPYCDPHQPHGFITYTGMEGRCQFCGGTPSDRVHR